MEHEARTRLVIAALRGDIARQQPGAFDLLDEAVQDQDSNVALDLRELAEAVLRALAGE